MQPIKKPPKDYAVINIPQNPEDEISGIRLIDLGWKKGPNSTYLRDGKTIKYDGNHWFLNDQRITTIKDTWF